MSKSKSPEKKITPEQGIEFLENFQKMRAGLNEPSQAISIRVPANVLRSFRILAQAEDRSYQTMMNQALREFLAKKS